MNNGSNDGIYVHSGVQEPQASGFMWINKTAK